jgi:hypothetical protein
MRLGNCIVCFALMILVSNCATSTFTSGKDFDSTKVAQIVKGKTTSDDLLNTFGPPFMKTVISANEEKWMYSFTKGQVEANGFTMDTKAIGTMKTLDVLLKDGVVTNYSYNEGPMPATHSFSQ